MRKADGPGLPLYGFAKLFGAGLKIAKGGGKPVVAGGQRVERRGRGRAKAPQEPAAALCEGRNHDAGRLRAPP